MFERSISSIATGFIATGPNIASQNLLFEQLSARLQTEINGPVVVLRSGDASNLKAALKQIIRDATNRRTNDDEGKTAYEHEV
jgi:origin recognition complex subunit 3